METIVLFIILREFIEILDGIKSIVKGNSLNMIDVLMRNLLECTIYVKFIFQDGERVEERAAAYQLKSIYNKLYECEVLDINSKIYKKERETITEALGDKVIGDFSAERQQLRTMINKYDLYKRVDKLVRVKHEKTQKNRRVKFIEQFQRDIHWYNMISDEDNLRKLAAKV